MKRRAVNIKVRMEIPAASFQFPKNGMEWNAIFVTVYDGELGAVRRYVIALWLRFDPSRVACPGYQAKRHLDCIF